MTWLFWSIAGALTAVVLALLSRPLLRAGKAKGEKPGGELAGNERADYDIAVYKDQLAEVARDHARGTLTAPEAKAAKTEIERRLLAADQARQAAGAPTSKAEKAGARAAALLIAAALPAVTLGLYLWLGAPGLPSLPFAEREAERQDSREFADLADQLAARMKADPSDPRGWELLARTSASLGRFPQAVEAYRQAIQRGGMRADLASGLGEALTAVANGNVTPEAKQAFQTAVDLDPQEQRARYYLGLSEVQAGEPAAALEIWTDLARDTPAEAPWRAGLLEQIAALVRETGLDPGDLTPQAPAAVAPGPSQAEVDAAAEMTPEERDAFIRSMVARLAERLEEEPDDLDGWLRLAQAYRVLGEREAAIAAFRRAEPLAADLPVVDNRRQAVADGLRALGEQPN